MKIAFLSPEYPHPETGSSGGIGTSIRNLATALLKEGVSVRVLVYGQKKDHVFEDHGIIIQQIKNVKVKGLSWFLTQKKIEKVINQLYSEKKIDLIEAADWTGITSFIKPNKCPLVIRLHGSDAYFCHLDNRPVKWINKFYERRALQKADKLISVSRYTADLTNSIFDLDKKITIIPNGIDAEFFHTEGKNYTNKEQILYFGSLIRKKGVLELPLIFNEVVENRPDAKLILIGKDVSDVITGNLSTWQMMQSLFSDKAIKNVEYSGSITYAEIKEKIEMATVCVFPSFAEAFPVSWLEAMALEKPIVASNIGWAKEMIDDGINGFLEHPKNHSDYASKINMLLSDAQRRNELGIFAREKVIKEFEVSVVAQQNLTFYNKILTKNNSN